MADASGPILLYDGVCGFCDASVRFLLKHDRREVFRFAPLQGEVAREILSRRGKDPSRLETVYVVLDPGQPSERLLPKSRAVLFVAGHLGGPWQVLRVFQVLPTRWLDWVYDRIASVRYRILGKKDACLIPEAKARSRFLDRDAFVSR